MEYYAYTGKVLRVNLSTKTVTEEATNEKVIKDYMGGAGMAIKYLFDEVPAETDPLSEENKLYFALGPLGGTAAPCASRMTVTAKSPLTNCVGMSMTGGHFPVEMKFAGYDMIIIEGKAEEPSYLWIKDGKVKIRSAKKVWGMTTFDAQQMIKDDLNDQNIRVACIGPAGENLSAMACIINERRAAGRKGLGAVMGSKNLKAIAIRGTNTKLPIADPTEFRAAVSRMQKAMKESPILYPEFSKLGTPMVVHATTAIGIFPAKNYEDTGKWVPKALGNDDNNERRLGNEHCYRCPVGCSQIKLAKNKYKGKMSAPEFETFYSLGSTLLIDDTDAVIAGDRYCDEIGIDTMSAGATIGFAMELYERGILTDADTDGMAIKWGDSDIMMKLLEMMAYRVGIGDILSDGSRKAAQKIGKGADYYAMHVKGLELPAYDVRGAKAHGLNYATSYTGADHNRGYAFQEIFDIPVPEAVDRFAYEGKGKLTVWNQDIRSVTCDCAPMCAFLMDMALPAIAIKNTRDLVSSATGVEYTEDEVYAVGARMVNLAHIYNVLAGGSRADDTLPPRLINEEIKDGPSKGHLVAQKDLDFMLDEYYSERGWDKNGIPTEEKLAELNIPEAVEKLKEANLL